ncbi:hypothetical protein TWF718_010459 [Orbilia javanica]|uniref:Uncharacterized protein n=1 Tax=Orbilia javanica TaxID=47235 RepID=A0AAN8MM10_9PEZI
MAESGTKTYPIASLYETHPHVLTDIMYYCTPTTFDALRYTCKAVYSMSLDPDLLEHHLKTIVHRQHEIISGRISRFYFDVIHMDSKFDTLDNSHGNLWRLRGLLLQEFLRMQSSWRIGEYKKVVVELDVFPENENEQEETTALDGPWFDGTLQVVPGTVRADTFALLWGDTKQTHLRAYHFTNSKSYGLRKINGPQGTTIRHEFSAEDNAYRSTKFSTKSINKKKPQALTLKIDNEFDISINEGSYVRDPNARDPNYYISEWYRYVNSREPLSTFLRAKFQGGYTGKYEEEGPVDLAYELSSSLRKDWRVPAISISNIPNVMIPDHSGETIKLFLGKNGKCDSKGYAAGLDSGPYWKWKVFEPRRLKEDVSRLGIWRDVSIEFERGEGEKGAVLRLLATISKNLVRPEPKKRFLLANSKIMNPDDWLQIEIPLVLPPVAAGDRRGRLVLATAAPAAYFRRRGMRDPQIPWADEGFLDYNWDSKKNNWEGGIEAEQLFIRTGAMINSELLDAEILTRIVGWTDDGAVWVWDVTEKHILDAGELAMPQDSREVLEVAAKKLGYVKDVKGIFVTGDRLVQRIALFTYGKEQKVHKVGEEHSEENDSGISFLRQEAIMRKISEAKERKGYEQQGEFGMGDRHQDGDGESATVPQPSAEGNTEGSSEKWRMITYTFGQPKGGGSASYRIDGSGNLEDM